MLVVISEVPGAEVSVGPAVIKCGVRVGDWILVDKELLVPGVDKSVVGVNPSVVVGDCVFVPSVLVVDTELLASIKCGVEVDTELLVPRVDELDDDVISLVELDAGADEMDDDVISLVELDVGADEMDDDVISLVELDGGADELDDDVNSLGDGLVGENDGLVGVPDGLVDV